jgi:hypothetical protein
LNFPFWGDEASLCVNFLDRGYLDLARQLECNQVAPLFFLWGEFTAFRLLGPSEWALRLLPVLAGLASLGLFWHLARLALRPAAAALAIGFLAVARWPVTMCTSVKPYSLDLFFALALIVVAYHYLRRPQQTVWLALLVALVPVALLSSYPSVFIAGSISVVLLPTAWRGGRKARGLFLAYNLLLGSTFLANILIVGREQLDPVAGSVENYMVNFWRDGFPPDNPWRIPLWLLLQTTGRMMAYPTGDANGGSTATFLLFLVGAWLLARQRRWGLLGMCLVPFGLNLVAALVCRYPYGGCCRLSQHLAPAICLLAGGGLGWLIERMARQAAARTRALQTVCALLALFAGGQQVADVAKPYRDNEALWSVRLSRLLVDQHSPADQVVIWNVRKKTDYLLRWQLGRYLDKLRWDGEVDWEQLEKSGGDLWCVSLWSGEEAVPDAARHGKPAVIHRPGWVLVDQVNYTFQPWQRGQYVRCCRLARWTRSADGKVAHSPPVLGAWPP